MKTVKEIREELHKNCKYVFTDNEEAEMYQREYLDKLNKEC